MKARLGAQLLTSDAEDADKMTLPPAPDPGAAVIADFLLRPSMMQEENGNFTARATIYNMTSQSEEFSGERYGRDPHEILRLLWMVDIRSYLDTLINGRFRDNGDGTVSDNLYCAPGESGITWKRCSEGQNWTGSECVGEVRLVPRNMVAHRNNNHGVDVLKTWPTFAGHNDWHVTNTADLHSLVLCGNGPKAWGKTCNEGYTHPTIDTTFFPNTPDRWYWSSESLYLSSDKWQVVDFSTGAVANVLDNDLGAVRLARGESCGDK